MFGLLKAKLPVSDEQQEWVDRSFVRLGKLLGVDRLLETTVVLPTPEHFPDPYDCSEEALQSMFRRVASAMGVDASEIDIQVFDTEHSLSRSLVPFFSGKGSGAGGLYYHDPTERPKIAVNEAELKDPMALVAVIAHEIGHIILLRPGLVDRDEPDMEPLNDLLTIFLGFGVFTANSAFRFSQFTNNQSQGWSSRRLGYLSEPLLGYALARFAFERREAKPAWASLVNGNISPYMKRSMAWLSSNQQARLLS